MGPLSSLPGRGPLVRAAGEGRSLLLRLPHQHPTGDQPTNRYPLQPSPCPGLPLSPGSLCGLPVSAPTLSAVPLPRGKHQHVLPSSQPSGDKVGSPPSGAHCCPDLDQLSCQPSSALPALEPRLSSPTRGSLRCTLRTLLPGLGHLLLPILRPSKLLLILQASGSLLSPPPFGLV